MNLILRMEESAPLRVEGLGVHFVNHFNRHDFKTLTVSSCSFDIGG